MKRLIAITTITLEFLLVGIQGVMAEKILHIALLGDSNTSIGGDLCDQPKGWTYWFRQAMQPVEIRSYARSGATWTNTIRTRLDTEEYTEVLSDNNVVYNQVMRLKEAIRQGQSSPDVIIIAAGTNDAWFKSKRPGIYSKTVQQSFLSNLRQIKDNSPLPTSLAESVRFSVELLIDAFPEARIILLTPMQTTKASYEETRRVGDIIEEVARRMSVPVIRLDFITGIYNNREALSPHFTSDGTHTSVEGARRNGKLLAKLVKPLLWE